ncbi:MAG: UvrB/UvrC motif-containing protein [bacterium]
MVAEKEHEMREAAKRLDFELAALLRDEIRELSKRFRKFDPKNRKKHN